MVHLLAIAGRAGVRADPGRLRHRRLRGAAAGRPAAGRPAPDGRPVPGRRAARGAGPGARPARPDGADRHRPAAGQSPRRRPDLGRGGDPPPRRPAAAGRRHRRAARQPGPGRRGDQAGGRVAAQLLRHRGRAVVFDSVEDAAGPDGRPRPGRRRGLGAGAARLRPARLPGHARGRATCRCRPSCWRRACGTWCASPTPG